MHDGCDLPQIFDLFFKYRNSSLYSLFKCFDDKEISMEDLGIQICLFVKLDEDIFVHFNENDEKFINLLSNVYFPALQSFLEKFCIYLFQESRVWLKSNDGCQSIIKVMLEMYQQNHALISNKNTRRTNMSRLSFCLKILRLR